MELLTFVFVCLPCSFIVVLLLLSLVAGIGISSLFACFLWFGLWFALLWLLL